MVKNFSIAQKNPNRCNKNSIVKSKPTAEATGNLIGNKIADKLTSASKKMFTKGLHNNNETEEDAEITTHKKRYISPEKRQHIIDELRLVPKKMHILEIFDELMLELKKYTYLLKKEIKLSIN